MNRMIMMMSVRSVFAFLFFFLMIFSLQAQNRKIEVFGKVVENQSEQAIPYATIVLYDSDSSKIRGGTITDESGNFYLVTDERKFYLEVSFIGFEKKQVREFKIKQGLVSLGTIRLAISAQNLEEATVTAERSTMEFKLDKRVFNVGKDLSTTGASALEVLNNVPSVNVNIEGEISLRGSSGVQILINGKPSVLASEQGNALGTITADMIEKIEVITNPSAKYDAEGTSGIINIVLKKEERKGLNGSVSVNTGIPHNHSLGLSLNRRTEKFNLFTQFGVGYRSLPRYNENINSDFLLRTSLLSEGDLKRNEQFYNLILGTDYHINKTNVLTLSGSFALEYEDQPGQTDYQYKDSTESIVSEWFRKESTEAINPKYQYELQYKSDFKDNKDHMLLFSATGHFFGKDKTSEFEDVTLYGNDVNGNQLTKTDFKEVKYMFKLDYAKPFSSKFTLEAGSQYIVQGVSNDYEVSDLIGGEWVVDTGLTNVFDYNQNVLGVYGTAAYENKRFGVKAGLRFESTDLSTCLENTDTKNERNYNNLFPSLHVSYKLGSRISVQAGYSRRIYRPRLWDLNPFFSISNSYNIRTGNPELQPEFTDSYEITGILTLKKFNFNLSIYQRNTTDVIERVNFFENNISTTMPYNIGIKNSTGIEFNTKYIPHKKISFMGDFNYYFYARDGVFEEEVFDFSADTWSTRWTMKVKFPVDIDFEITGNYRSNYQTVQAINSDQLFADMGLRKKIMKGKAVINLSIRDLFASRKYEMENIQDDYYIHSKGYRGRMLTLGFSYGFGKGEAMEYSGVNRYH